MAGIVPTAVVTMATVRRNAQRWFQDRPAARGVSRYWHKPAARPRALFARTPRRSTTYVRTFVSRNHEIPGTGGDHHGRIASIENGTTPSHADPSNCSMVNSDGISGCNFSWDPRFLQRMRACSRTPSRPTNSGGGAPAPGENGFVIGFIVSLASSI